MSRDLETNFQAALDDPVLYQLYFVHLDFDGDPAYLHNGMGTINWNGQDWLGTGDLGAISAIEEASDGRATGIQFQLSGIDADLLSKAMTGDYQGREFNVYMVLLTAADYSVIGTPKLLTSGEMDQMQVFEGGEDGGSITLTGESYAANDQGVNEVRWTAEAQDLLSPGDKFCEFVDDMVDKELLWGTPSPAPEVGPVVSTPLRYFDR